VACCVLLMTLVAVRPGTPGWPPTGWVVAACDVGQGDALVLNAGSGAGVVVDAGPDPVLVDRCLRRLGIRRVPLLVLTHFHRDHVDGLVGVLRGRALDGIEVTALADPPDAVASVERIAVAEGIRPVPAPYAVTRRVGEVTLQVLWPPPTQPRVGPGDGSTANDASVVLLASVRGVRLLLTGDIEPRSQGALARSLVGLRVDVLKVPHHGSRFQDLEFLTSLGAQVALVSAGADNDYGHPSEETLAPLRESGAQVLRTDLDGDLLVVEHDGRISTRSSR
jgi:competence protein ComEC